MEAAIRAAVDGAPLAGAVAMQWRHGRIGDVVAAGQRDPDRSLPMERDTIFRIASMTKPLTTVAALMLLDDGRFALDDPIASHAPELAAVRVLRDPDGPLHETDEAHRQITFRDLLTHRSGLTYGEFHAGPIRDAFAETLGALVDSSYTPDEWIARLATLPLIGQPGAGFHYGVSTDLLGLLIGRMSGESLGSVLSRRVFTPLGMRDTTFDVPHEKRGRRAALIGFDEHGQLTTLARTPGGHAQLDRPAGLTFESGGQGLWSTLDDYLAFARMLIGDRGVPALLRPETLRMMTSNQLTPAQRASARMFGSPLFAAGHGYGMGVAVVLDPDRADPLCCRGGVGTVGWPGAYGGWWQADPNDQSVLIFLTHNMVELSQMPSGVGLGVWDAISRFHAIGTA